MKTNSPENSKNSGKIYKYFENLNGGNKKKNLCSKIDLQEDSKLSSSSWTGGKLFKILVGNVSTPVIGQGRVNEEVWLQSDEVKEKNIIPIFTNHVTPLSCHVTSDEPIAEQKTTQPSGKD